MSMKSYVNEDLLIPPVTPESAYILGFLWGDGTILLKRRRIQLELIKTDLDQIRPVFNTVGKWTYACRQRPKRQQQASLCCTNTRLVEILTGLDYTKKSTKDFRKILELVPNHLVRYFILGLFDADGCFYINEKLYLKQCCIAGTYAQNWSALGLILLNLNIRYNIQYSKNTTSRSSCIRFGGKDNLIRFGQYLYPNGFEFGLLRKFRKIEHLLT